MDQTRVLLTGATGFVGGHVVSHLLSAQRPLTLAVRAAASCPAWWHSHDHIRVVETGAIETSGALGDAMADVSTVVHLAGLAHVHGQPGRETDCPFLAANAVATERLVRAAAEMGRVEKFINISSLAAVTDNASDRIVDDEAAPTPTTPYGRSKLAAEAYVHTLAERGVLALSLRPPLIVGAEARGNWGALQRLAASGLPLPFGSVNNRRSLIGVETLATAIAHLCASNCASRESGAYCIADTGTVSLAEIVTELRAGMGRSARLFACPPQALSGVAKLARQQRRAAGLLGNLEVDSRRFVETFGFPALADVRASIRRSGHTYRPDRTVPDRRAA